MMQMRANLIDLIDHEWAAGPIRSYRIVSVLMDPYGACGVRRKVILYCIGEGLIRLGFDGYGRGEAY